MVPHDDLIRAAFTHLEAGDWGRARDEFRSILKTQSPEDSLAWYGLSRALAGLGDQRQSDEALERAYRLNGKEPRIAATVGARLLSNGAAAQAMNVARNALRRNPNDVDLLSVLGDAYEALDQKSAVLKVCARLTKIVPHSPLPHLKAARIRMRGLDMAGAEEEFRAALSRDPGNRDALGGLADIRRLTGDVGEARRALLERANTEPNPACRAVLRFKAAATQPVIARDRREIDEARGRYLAALASGPAEAIEDPYAVGLGPNFFLNYQARNDRDAQVALAAYHLAATPSLGFHASHAGQNPGGRRIRVGIVGAFFSKHTVGYLSYGLVAGLDRQRFDVRLFRVPMALKDSATEEFAAAAPIVDLPSSLEEARLRIVREELDILHFPEIGMDHFTYFLAYARLATLQTTTWGHPITSGLPHIDMFLSVDEMEPPGSEGHYSENLVRLKQLSFAGAIPPVVPTSKAEAGLGLGPAYVCAQSLYKVHPDFDPLVAQILRRDPEATVYFLSIGEPADTRFRGRLETLLGSQVGRVKILPRTTATGFLKLVGAADVALDVPQWSGGRTSLETFQMGTPVVHLPGEFMRGRHTLAFYRRMGVSGPVANSPSDYAEIAVRLVHDGAFRAEVRDKIDATRHTLFNDQASIREIEDVWLAALAQRT